MREGERVEGAVRAVWRNKWMSVEAVKGTCEAVVYQLLHMGMKLG